MMPQVNMDDSHRGHVVGATADLELLFAQLDALHELASDLDASNESGRIYDFSIRWGTFIAGRLQRLDHYHRQDRLTSEEEARYQALATALRDARPLLARFQLTAPAADGR